jgi:hypothetical protein
MPGLEGERWIFNVERWFDRHGRADMGAVNSRRKNGSHISSCHGEIRSEAGKEQEEQEEQG